MRITDDVVAEAESWVKSINKYFRIKQKIVVRKGADKKKLGWYAFTNIPYDRRVSITVDLYPNHGRPNLPLFQVIYHEMVHLLLWPLTKDNEGGSKQDKAEEKVVLRLERIMAKIIGKIGDKHE